MEAARGLAGRLPPLGPSEQTLAGGTAALGDGELLGLVLDGGAGTPAARALAERLLGAAGGIAHLDRLDGVASRAAGVRGRRGIVRLRAALELGRRAGAAPLGVGAPVKDAAAVYAHVRGRLPQLEREVFWVLLLDGKNRLRGEIRVSEGSLTAALVHPREVFAPAIRAGAAAVVLVHNHPSGDPTPSSEDRAITERLRQVGELVGIRVLDHVVVGRGRWASLAEAGRW